ncbi:MAG: hypothetical protein ABI867_32310 [Kofleriaceae bacterium]
MQSMRSVWLSMRDGDEEPPANGLAALMAAARDKAAAMKPQESWWRRAFAVLVRPPVLAMATIVVLVGGAVVLKNRGTELDATTTQAVPAESSPRGELRSANSEKQDPPPEAPEASKDKLVGSQGRDPRPDPVKEVDTGTGETATITRHVPEKPPPVEPPKVNQTEEPAGLVIADSDDRPGSAKPTVQPSESVQITGGTRTRTQAEVVDQLVRQAETAAGRKDCAAVRATAQRIKKLDSTTYKSRVAKQAAIKNCLK